MSSAPTHSSYWSRPEGYAVRPFAILRRVSLPWPVRLLLFYLFLITVIGKGPTYLTFPPVYLSEIVMAVTVLWIVDRYGLVRAALPDEGPLTISIWMYVILGAIVTSFCVSEWGLDAIRDAAIWFYAAFYFVGRHLGSDAARGERVWNVLCVFWVVALFWCTTDQLTYMLFGWLPSQFGPEVPWRGEGVLSNSGNESIQHMALASMIMLSSNLHRGRFQRFQWILTPLAILALGVIAVSRGRGVKVGLFLAVLLLLILKLAPGRPMQTSSKVAIGVAIVLMLSLAGLMMMSDAFFEATQLDRFAEADPSSPEGTAHFRMIWWKNLFREVHEENPLFGLGFGQSLNIYNPFLHGNEDEEWPVRSPHNFNITVFSRMGYVGAALWTFILAAGVGGLFYRVWKGRWRGIPYDKHRREEVAFWIVLLVITWGNATFGVLMEGPVLGIWFWFALGFAKSRSEPVIAQRKFRTGGLEPNPLAHRSLRTGALS